MKIRCQVKIHATFIRRKSDPDAIPELIAAWDEISRDENFEGFEKDREAELKRIGDDLDSYRAVVLEIDLAALLGAFETHVVVADLDIENDA